MSMINFKYVESQNFFSVGNNPIRIDLNTYPKTLIVGTNGSGKSSGLLDALSFVLFGKPYRKVNKSQIVNSINNKNCLVKSEFQIESDNYLVIRGMSPNKFEIYKNDILISQDANVKDYQKKFESDILGFSFETFKQIIALGSGWSTSFMKLNPAQRREVLEEVLDLKILSRMSRKSKEDLGKLKLSYDTISESLKFQKDQLANFQSQYNNLFLKREEIQKKAQENNDHISEIIKTLENEQNILKDELKNYYSDFSKNLKIQNDLQQTLLFEKYEIESLKKDCIEPEDHCVSCGTALKEDHFKLLHEEYQKKVKTLEEKRNKFLILSKELNDIDSVVESLRTEISNREKRLNDIKIEISKQTSEITTLDTSMYDELYNSYSDQIKILTSEVSSKEKKQSDLLLAQSYYGVCDRGLKDDGIRSLVLSRFVPKLNSYVNKYLSDMNFFASFTLSSTLEETIKSRHRDIYSYENFSQGERQRIDLALLFAWRDIAREKNSVSTNLLILDETFDSSLDETGIEDLNMILNKFTNENIFVISHSLSVHDTQFSRTLQFEKIGHFSVMKEV